MKRITILLALLVVLGVSALAQNPQDPVAQPQHKRAKGQKHWQKFDQNNDGQIAREEWTRKPKAFDRLDLNHDGFITKEEMKEAKLMRRKQK